MHTEWAAIALCVQVGKTREATEDKTSTDKTREDAQAAGGHIPSPAAVRPAPRSAVACSLVAW